MRFLTKCLVCAGMDFKTMLESTFDGSPLEAARYFLANRHHVAHGRIQRCLDCGFTFTNPQFFADDYNEIYKNIPRVINSEISLAEAHAQRFQRIAKWVRSDVGKFDRFLDFGSGSGGFLAAMNDPTGMGFEVGEPGNFSVGPSLVTTGNIFDVAGTVGFEKKSFDLITAFCVFEHLPNLEDYVKVLRSLLKPLGHMVIGLPNVKSWNAKLLGGHWNQYLLEHLWYFDRETTKRFMEREGFHETRYRSAAYDAPVAHIARRVAQTYGLPTPHLGSALSSIVLPVPIGLMYGVFQLR